MARLHRIICRIDGSVPVPTIDELRGRIDHRSTAEYGEYLSWRRYYSFAQALRLILYGPLFITFGRAHDAFAQTICGAAFIFHAMMLVLEGYLAAIASAAIREPGVGLRPKAKMESGPAPAYRSYVWESPQLYESLGIDRFGQALNVAIRWCRGIEAEASRSVASGRLVEIVTESILAERVHLVAISVETALVIRALAVGWWSVAWIAPFFALDLGLVALQRYHRVRIAQRILGRRRPGAAEQTNG